MEAKKQKAKIVSSIVALLVILLYATPFFVLINIAFKSPTELTSYWKIPSNVQFDNFLAALTEGKLFLALKNSVVITVFSVLLVVICGALAAYPLSRHKTKLNRIIKGFTLGVMMVPPLSILVSLYSTMVAIKGINTYWGIVLILVTFELPLSIFLFSNFITSIPTALDEAATIDGCGPIRTFFLIIMPQLKPVTASIVILTGMHCWNDYQFSLYFLQNSSYKTVPLSIAAFFSQTTSNLNAAAAAAVLAVLPAIILFLSLQKYFIQGMVDSAVK